MQFGIVTGSGQSTYLGQMGHIFSRPCMWITGSNDKKLDNLVYIFKNDEYSFQRGIQSICQHQTVIVVNIIQCYLYSRSIFAGV